MLYFKETCNTHSKNNLVGSLDVLHNVSLEIELAFI
jgi:hypothetical protein